MKARPQAEVAAVNQSLEVSFDENRTLKQWRINMSYLGSWAIDDYVTIMATTHNPTTGAAAAADPIIVRIYEDDTDTEIVSDQAMTAFDSVTGLYKYKQQLTAAAGFEAGKCYTAMVSATVATVAAIVTHTFQIQAKTTAVTVSDKTGYGLADDAITAAKFDESTAFPLKSADTGATAVARTGADSDTLETLSDQIDTRSDGTGVTLHADYDAAKTASQFDASSDEVNVGAINGANVTESSAGNLAAAFSFFFDEGTPTKSAEDIGAVSLSEQDIADIGAAAASGLLSGGTFIKVDAAGRVYTKSFGRRLT